MFVIPLFATLCALFVFYIYMKRRNHFWKERGVPTVDANFVFGVSHDFLTGRRSLEQIHEDIYNKAGTDEPFVGFYNLLKPGLLVRDPALIRQITTTDFSQFHERSLASSSPGLLAYSVNALHGEEWKVLRQKLVTIFSSSKLKKMHGLIEECAELLVEHHLR